MTPAPLDFEETTTCKQCGNVVNILAVFPGGRCIDCHTRKFDADAARTGTLPRPDFSKVLNHKRP